jgi:hypothetical protein
MSTKTGLVFLFLSMFVVAAPLHLAFAAEDDDEEATGKAVKEEQQSARSEARSKEGKMVISCKPGSKVTVRTKKASGKVGNVIVVCDENGEAVVDIGSKVVAPGTKHGNISTHYEVGDVTTVTGKGGKASVNIGSVKIGK